MATVTVNKSNVTTGKPKVTGALFRAPLGTKLPTDASSELDAAFKALGYASEAGVTSRKTISSHTIPAWGGEEVLTEQDGETDVLTVTCIEAINPEVLKAVHGDGSVTGTLAAGLSVSVGGEMQEHKAWVIDMILRGGVLKRIVLPNAIVTDVGDVTYNGKDAVSYPLTIKADPDTVADAKGIHRNHYEYFKGN